MRANSLIQSCLALIVLFTTISTALPEPGWLKERLDGLIRRQQEDPSPTVTQSASATRNTEAAASSTADDNNNDDNNNDDNNDNNNDDNNNNDNNDDEETSTDDAAASSTGRNDDDEPTSTRNSTRTTAIDPRLPPGGVQMMTPAPIEGSQYYKVGFPVTFAWNYTSLSVTPSAVDVLVSCLLNSATYTISSNMSVEETGRLTWDTGGTATSAVVYPVATYALIIHDSAADVTDVPQAGHLGSYNQYQFGMYTPEPYVPLNEFRCATCSNGALSTNERHALGALLFTSVVTVLSFTWFAAGFGVFS